MAASQGSQAAAVQSAKLPVYFAGSIRGGRADAELYMEIVQHLCKTYEVLTEHVASPELKASGEVGEFPQHAVRRHHCSCTRRWLREGTPSSTSETWHGFAVPRLWLLR